MSNETSDDAALTRLILVLGTAGFASSFALRAVEPLVSELARDLDSDPHTTALLSTAFALPYALIQPVLGPIGDALGKERVVIACLVVLTLMLTASTAAPDLAWLFGLRIVAGAAAGGCIPLSLALLGDRVAMANRQVAIGRFLVAVILGQLLGATFAGLVESTIGWRGVFGVTAVVALVGLVATSLFLDRKTIAGRLDFGQALARYRSVFANRRARVLFVAVFVEGVVIFGMFPHLAPMLESQNAGGAREAGLMLAGFGLGGLLYAAIVAFLVRVLGPMRMLVVGGWICAATLLAVGLVGLWQFDALALALTGLGFYMLHNTYQVQVTEVVPEARGSATAFHAFSFYCGQALGVPVFGAALLWLGPLWAMALAALAALALGHVSSTLLSRPQPPPAAR